MNSLLLFFEKTPDIRGDLFPNISSLIAHLIAFVVLILVIYHFAWKPFKKFIKSREEYIQSNITSSEERLNLSLENIQKSEESLHSVKSQADKIIEASKIEAYKLKEEILNKAKKEVEIQRENFNNEMEQTKNNFFKKQQEMVVDTAYQISKQFIKKNNSEETDKQFIEKLLNEFDSHKKQPNNKQKTKPKGYKK